MHSSSATRRLAAGLLLLALGQASAEAATINVFPDDVVAPCRLRNAIQSANTDTSVDGCTAGSGTDQLVLLTYNDKPFFSVSNATGADEDANASGDLDVTSAIIIVGADPARSVILGPAFDRAIEVHGTGTLTLNNVTVIGGSVVGANANDGGVIRKVGNGALSINRSVLRGGRADLGGGIDAGGAGAFTLDRVTLFDNSASSGGGISLRQTSSAMAVFTNVTLSGNSATSRGGGLYATSDVRLRNVTIARNQATGSGGMHYNGTADTTGVNFANSLIVDNHDASGAVSDLYCNSSGLQLGSRSHTMIGELSNCTFASFAGIPASSDARLTPLFDFGAGIPTHALMPGSAALGAGNPSTANPLTACVGMDARGVARSTGCEVGAYEQRFDVVVNSVSDLPDTTPGDGLCRALGNVCTLRALAMEAAASPGRWFALLPPGIYTLSRPFNGFDDIDGGDLDFKHTDFETPQQITLYGAGAGQTRIVGGGFDRVMEVRGRSATGPQPVYVHYPLSFALVGATVEGGVLNSDPFQQDPNSVLLGGGIKITGGKSLLFDVVVRDNYVESLPAEEDSNAGGVSVDTAQRSNVADRPYRSSAHFERFAIIDNATSDEGGGYSKYAGGLFAVGGGESEISDGITLTNGLIAGNYGRQAGGAYINGRVAASFLTIVDNSSGPLSPPGFTQWAGGITVQGQTNTVRGLLIANNVAGDAASDCEALLPGASFVSLGYNLIRTHGSGCILSGDLSSNLLGVDPMLAPRSEIAGMPAYLPQDASPAIDAVPVAGCDDVRGFGLVEDSRGARRAAVGGDGCDIGAIEIEAPLFSDGFE